MKSPTAMLRVSQIVVCVLLSQCVIVCVGHVGLIYPPARKYALDFLDSARTSPPCGMARGVGPITDLKAGSTFTVSWYLGYAHEGGFRLELLMYDSVGNVSKTYYLTSSTDAFIGFYNVTLSSYNVTLPAQVTACSNCTIRLVRQALNWGPSYVFWSCADVNILPASRYVPQCLGHGAYNSANNSCVCENTYSGSNCQFDDECNVDADCGIHGKCRRVTDYSYPQKQCFCQQGWFGAQCDQLSSVSTVVFNSSLYEHVLLSPSSGLHLYYRIIQNTYELEVVLQGRTQSYVSLGWKPTNTICVPYSLRPSASNADEPVPEPAAGPIPSVTVRSQTQLIRFTTPITTTVPHFGNVETDSVPEPEVTGSTDINGMDCTDIVIGAAVGRLSRVRDYYTRDRSTPREDEFYGGTQSLTAAVGEETEDGTTTIIFRKLLDARENTDHSIRNEPMTVIWAHGQAPGDTPVAGDFYRPDEVKYHSTHRGLANINFYGRSTSGTSVPTNEDSWSWPTGCTPASTCNYRAVWSVNPATDVITFTITARQPPNTWTGIAFASKPFMENMDAYIGYVDSSNQGIVIDGWTSSRYSRPVRDTIQSAQQASVSYVSGVLTLTFQRPMDTRDAQDLKFSDTDCYYFMFPVAGGRMSSDMEFLIHSKTPTVSSTKLCIRSTTWSSSSEPVSHGGGHNIYRVLTYLLCVQAVILTLTTRLVGF